MEKKTDYKALLVLNHDISPKKEIIKKLDTKADNKLEKIEEKVVQAKIEIVTKTANAIINWINTGSKVLIMREESKSYFNKIEADIIKINKEIERESSANNHELNKEKEKTKRLELIINYLFSEGKHLDQTLREAMKIAIENITKG